MRVSLIPSHWSQEEEHAEPAGGWVERGDGKGGGRGGREVRGPPESKGQVSVVVWGQKPVQGTQL